MARRNIAILYIIASAFCFALMNLFVRLSGDVPTIEKTFFRNFVALLVAFGMIQKQHLSLAVPKKAWSGLFIRSAFGTVGIWCNFYAIGRLELADASILNKLSPFFVLLFSVLILKEKLTLPQAGFVGMAFVGALFIVKPGFAFLASGTDSFAACMGAFGGLCAGLAYTYVRKLGELGVAGPLVVFYFSTFSCLAAVPYCVLYGVWPQMEQLIFLLCAGLAASGGQFFITAAYMHAPAREISIYDYTQIIFATLLGFVILGEVPDVYSWIGYVIIIGASFLLFLYNNNLLGRKPGSV